MHTIPNAELELERAMDRAFVAAEIEAERRAFASDPDFRGVYVPANPAVRAVDPTAWPAVPAHVAPPLPGRLAGAHIARFVHGGNATLTVTSNATGARFTFRVRQPKPDATAPFFVSVLTGPDNETAYTFVGSLFPDGTYRHGKRSTIAPDAPSARAAAWFFGLVLAGNFAKLDAQCVVQHAGKCCRCGRKLTVPSSIETGIGPECAKH
jgi:hypothetical protein